MAMGRQETFYGHRSTGDVLWAQVNRERVAIDRQGTFCGHGSAGPLFLSRGTTRLHRQSTGRWCPLAWMARVAAV